MCQSCLVCVYDHPSDFPEHYVARLWHVEPGYVTPEPANAGLLTADTDLERLRDILRGRGYTLQSSARAGWDPQVLEVWRWRAG